MVITHLVSSDHPGPYEDMKAVLPADQALGIRTLSSGKEAVKVLPALS